MFDSMQIKNYFLLKQNNIFINEAENYQSYIVVMKLYSSFPCLLVFYLYSKALFPQTSLSCTEHSRFPHVLTCDADKEGFFIYLYIHLGVMYRKSPQL